MDEKKQHDDQALQSDLLHDPQLGDEITPDEAAIYAAGLSHPSDAEVDEIIAETLREEAADPVQPEPEPELFHDEEYRDTFGEGEGLNAAFDGGSTPPPRKNPTAGSKEEPPMKKKRPKRKKGYGLLGIPHILATVLWLAIIAAIGVTLGRMLWVSAADVLAFGREDQKVTLTITDDDTIDTITDKLHTAGLIRYPNLFKAYASLAHADQKISTGTFTLNTLYDYNALVNSMRSQSDAREEVDVVIPEGYTCRQIFQLLEDKGVCDVADLEDYAATGELDSYWFLEGVTRGSKYCLEGFLFPDTYRFYTHDDPQRVLEKMLSNFEDRFSDLMQQRLTALNEHLASVMAENGHDEAYIRDHQLSIRDVVIIASLAEKEAANISESYTICSVIYNRLYNWGDNPAFLNIDAALVYALDGNLDAEGKTKPLTQADLEMDSPYNTYTHTGLPAGPISNPGLSSLNAALVPEDTNYFYYALDPETGSHHFSETAAEHEQFLSSIGGE